MRKVLFIGGCNAEHVAANLPDRDTVSSLYRVPTACLAAQPFEPDPLLQAVPDPEFRKRLEFESSRRYLRILQEQRFDVIVIDFWRDAYVQILVQGSGFLSVGWEMLGDAALMAQLRGAGLVLHDPGSTVCQAAFDQGLAFLADRLQRQQPQAEIVLLDCPPVQQSLRDGGLVPLEQKFAPDVWAERYVTLYRDAYRAYCDRFSGAISYRFPDAAYSAPDAPWGEAALHYAPGFYVAAGEAVAGIMAA